MRSGDFARSRGWAGRYPVCRIVLWIGGAAAFGCTPFESDTVDAGPGGYGLDANAPGIGILDASGPAAPFDGPSSRCDPNTPFGAPTFVSNPLNFAPWIGGMRLSADSLTAYFHARGVPGRADNFDLYSATRAQASLAFADAAPLEGAGINTPQHETDPSVSGDGLLLVFSRSPLGQPSRLHYAMRSSVSEPFIFIGPVFASGWGDAPFLRADGMALYLAEQTDGGTRRDLYRSTRRDSGFDPPVRLPEINSEFDDTDPVVTPDDLTLYFGSNRSNGDVPAHARIWTATRPTAGADFSAPTPVTELDFPDADVTPTFITADGCTLYFFTASPVPPNPDTLYVVNKQGR